jgi:hypothetical protein
VRKDCCFLVYLILFYGSATANVDVAVMVPVWASIVSSMLENMIDPTIVSCWFALALVLDHWEKTKDKK